MEQAVMVKRGASLLGCLPFIVILILCLLSTLKDNQMLTVFSEQLYEYELPKDTKIIETQSLCGNLYGKSSSMDYAAVMLIKTTQSESSIKSYYFNAHYEAVEKGMIKPAIEIVRPGEKQLENFYVGSHCIHFNTDAYEETAGEYMIIIITDKGHHSYFDIRGKAQ